jgi:hypothetical protein
VTTDEGEYPNPMQRGGSEQVMSQVLDPGEVRTAADAAEFARLPHTAELLRLAARQNSAMRHEIERLRTIIDADMNRGLAAEVGLLLDRMQHQRREQTAREDELTQELRERGVAYAELQAKIDRTRRRAQAHYEAWLGACARTVPKPGHLRTSLEPAPDAESPS